jgi:hypothetical protein
MVRKFMRYVVRINRPCNTVVRKFMRYVVRINRPRGTVARRFMSYVAYIRQDKHTKWHRDQEKPGWSGKAENSGESPFMRTKKPGLV